MDSSKRQFLQQLGVLTAGASLVPLAEAKFPFSPERHEGSPRHRYAMLIDLRRLVFNSATYGTGLTADTT
ncbi:hypothetical protein ACH54_24505, partial [Salmonella enterica subsp. enterica serovar Infantis]